MSEPSQPTGALPAVSAGRRRLFVVFWIAISVPLVAAGGELLMRLGILFGVESLRDPAAYVHPFCNDDYHKLRFFWSRTQDLRPGAYVQHPRLGWVPDVEPPPAFAEATRGGDTPGPVIALFGDSFMSGVPPVRLDERIPHLLDDMIPEGRVVDDSVAGFGVDQIYLRFQDAVENDGPGTASVAVVGILLDDIDRVVERFRAGPKPYFVLADGELDLRGVPIDQTPEEWLEDHPVGITSYLSAFLQRQHQERVEWTDYQQTVFESECFRDEKETLTRKILENLVALARARGVRPVFVVFYGERALTVESWREDFLRSALAELHIEIIDTKPLLLAAAGEPGVELSDFYFPPPNGHLNDRGNVLVAQAIYDTLRFHYTWSSEAVRSWKVVIELGSAGRNDVTFHHVGWEDDRDHFSWTSQSRAFIGFPTPPSDTDFVLYLEALCALSVPGDARSLVIEVNGTKIHEEPLSRFPDCWTQHTITTTIDRDLVQGGIVSITLELPDLLTPVEAGFETRDERRLGVAVRSLTLRAVD